MGAIGGKSSVAFRKARGARSLSLPTTLGPRGTPRLALTRPTKTSSIWRGSFAFGASASIERVAIGGTLRMGGSGVIDQFLNVFTAYIDSGFGLLGGDVRFLSQTLIALDITLAGLFWALAGEADVIARLIKKTLYIGFFASLIGNFNGLAKIIVDSFLASA
jgi:hypothetical protein